ncbi:Protein CBG25074 [Caenorhabditis briggsae]|uniref:Protein CBG25074 n=1 Tax=Caenorhabditis briggsae TaxID=6238 RepID=H8WHB9_CAEBR|nr:Protein CBG25074 [Caenorhabditis briggsae]CCG58632.1 Protein CBG25074 [Caenorhabditis briggsae]
MSDEKMSGVSISPIDPDESIQLTLPNEQEASRSSITEGIAEEMLPVDPIGTVAQGESVPSFPPTSFSDTIAQLRLYFNQELSNEGAMPAVSADRAIHSAKRTSSVPIRQYSSDTVDENELAVKKPRFFSPQRQVLKPLNTSYKLAMSPEAPSSEHPNSLVEPLVVLQKSPEEPWAELLNRPKTQVIFFAPGLV